MLRASHKSLLPTEANPGQLAKVGGSAWVVYRFNAHLSKWVSQYWSFA